jgi:hypothetical protein
MFLGQHWNTYKCEGIKYMKLEPYSVMTNAFLIGSRVNETRN